MLKKRRFKLTNEINAIHDVSRSHIILHRPQISLAFYLFKLRFIATTVP
jgi:hypothetical protein